MCVCENWNEVKKQNPQIWFCQKINKQEKKKVQDHKAMIFIETNTHTRNPRNQQWNNLLNR